MALVSLVASASELALVPGVMAFIVTVLLETVAVTVGSTAHEPVKQVPAMALFRSVAVVVVPEMATHFSGLAAQPTELE